MSCGAPKALLPSCADAPAARSACDSHATPRGEVTPEVHPPIKPLAPPPRSRPAYSFPFLRCQSTLEAAPRSRVGTNRVSNPRRSSHFQGPPVRSACRERRSLCPFRPSSPHIIAPPAIPLSPRRSIFPRALRLQGNRATLRVTAAAGTEFAGRPGRDRSRPLRSAGSTVRPSAQV